MFNVCDNCGLYRADKIIDPVGPYAICPECGHKHVFRYLPLLIVAGASGAGKSTVCNALLGQIANAESRQKERATRMVAVQNSVLLDSDILWCPAFDTPEDGYRAFFEIWLRMAKNIGQSGGPVVLFGAGAGVPENIEPCVERRYFSAVHRLALVCDDDILIERLHARPQWRNAGHDDFVQSQVAFNRWFRETGPTLGITVLDTTFDPLKETAAKVAAWIDQAIIRQPSAISKAG